MAGSSRIASARGLRGLCVRALLPSILLFAGCGEGSSDDGDGGESGSAGNAGSSVAGSAGASGGSGNTGKGGSAGSSGSSGKGGAGGGTGATGGTASGNGGSSGDSGSSGSAGSAGASGNGGTAGGGTGTSSAADVARKLGREPNFLIGMGNDLPSDYVWENAGIYTLPERLDIHYYYLTQGWETWNEGGWFPYILGSVDVQQGSVPMATLYAMAGAGENNLSVLTDSGYMGPYWTNLKLLFERYGTDLDQPAIVHLDPDFWAFAQQGSGGDPTSLEVILDSECSALPNDLTGMGQCIVQLARSLAPKLVLGFHASQWAAGSAAEVGEFLRAIGAGQADIVVIDMLDRDAGCFEDGTLPQCQRGGVFYWDETNQTSPNFHEHIAWSKEVGEVLGVPILWWQIPFGVPSDTPGGTPGHFRDNRVKYIFEHVQEFVDAGGLGACFGTGAGDQTYIDSDGGQFANAVTGYYANPVPLP
jgi:hypothetical protein